MIYDWEKEAFRYYCLGLNSKEIGKLLDKSHRTIQSAMSRNKWKENRKQIKDEEYRKLVLKILKKFKNES